MLKCFFIKRKLPDYLDGSLSPGSEEGLKRHLDRCAGCRKFFAQAKQLVEISARKTTPELSDSFWKQFDKDLNARLDGRLAEGVEQERGPVSPLFLIFPRPVLVAVPLALIVVAIGLHLLYPTRYVRHAFIYDRQEHAIVEDMELLDELSDANGPSSLPSDEDYAAEMDVLFLLDPNSIEGIG